MQSMTTELYQKVDVLNLNVLRAAPNGHGRNKNTFTESAPIPPVLKQTITDQYPQN